MHVLSCYILLMEIVSAFADELKNKAATLLLRGYDIDTVANKLGCKKYFIYELHQSVVFQRLIYERSMAKLVAEGVPAAIQALIDIVKNPRYAPASRVSAADKIMNHTGCVVNEQGKLEKAPSAMTQAELQQRLQALQAEAGNRATPTITIEQSPLDVSKLF